MGLTMAVFKLELDFVNSFIDSRGKPRHQFRRKGFKKVTIKGRPGSPEFMEAYQALLESTGGSPAAEIGASRTKSGTVNAVAVALYKDDVFTKGLAKATQTPFRRIIDRFREHTTPSGRVYGENGMSTLKKERILDFLAGKTANAQKNSLKAVRFLVRFAISKGELAHDPTDGIDLIKPPKTLGHMTWKPPQVEQYRRRHALGTIARLAMELMLNIAARREDAHKIGRQHLSFDADRQLWKLTWRPSKTARSSGKILTIPILPSLQEAMEAIPREARADGVLTFLVNEYGRPFASAAAFGNKFADWCVAAGLQPVECEDGRVRNFRAHGLRKAALYTLLKAGGNLGELQAIGGHSSITELQKYIQEVEQDEQAMSGMAKVAAVQAKARTRSD
jgi:integrase/recombinase XerD